MKKQVIKWIAVIAGVIVGAWALLCIINALSGRWLTPSQVQRVVFRGYNTCDSPESDTVELSDSEIRKVVAYYNQAIYAGRATADSCTSEFKFYIELTDGTRINIREAGSPRMKVFPPQGDSYWINSVLLADYAQELIEKYELTAS